MLNFLASIQATGGKNDNFNTMRAPKLVDVDVERLSDELVARDAHLELLEADPAVRVVVRLLQPFLDRVLQGGVTLTSACCTGVAPTGYFDTV